jgi:hypothetical protein
MVIVVIGALSGLNVNLKNPRKETSHEKTLYIPFIDGSIVTLDLCGLV